MLGEKKRWVKKGEIKKIGVRKSFEVKYNYG